MSFRNEVEFLYWFKSGSRLKIIFGNLRSFEMKKISTCQLRFNSLKMRLEIANWKNSKISEIYNYRPQTKFAKVMFLQVSVILTTGGACMVAHSCSWLLLGGGMHGCSQGACVVAPGGRAWLLRGVCMVAPRGHAWLFPGGMRGCSGGACMVALGGMRGFLGACMVFRGGGHVWFFR